MTREEGPRCPRLWPWSHRPVKAGHGMACLTLVCARACVHACDVHGGGGGGGGGSGSGANEPMMKSMTVTDDDSDDNDASEE